MKSDSLSLLQTEKAILDLKRYFEDALAAALHLHRVSAPMFVDADSGLQDNLSGSERPVSFKIKAIEGKTFEIVHSLAKWKRMALARYQIPAGEGLYTDMNAIRADEASLSTSIHSVYVDQWDWERVITENQRSLNCLKQTVKTIYDAILATEHHICLRYSLKRFLPEKITFIQSEELLQRYSALSAKERENAAAKEYGAVFIIGIGAALSNGKPHDMRAPDYDDWSTETENGYKGLNGDILVYNPVLNSALELSSMGIRVNPQTMVKQLKISGCENRLKLAWHKSLAENKLPLTIGGGIGQSRLSMLLLQKRHIGEVQVSAWGASLVELAKKENIQIL